MSNRLWLRLPTGVLLAVGIAYNAGSILSGNGCGEYYESQSRLLFAADPRRDRQPVYIASLYYMVTARQRTDAGDLRHGQNGGAKSPAQSARVHITDVWRCRRMARRDSRSATLSPQNTKQPFKTYFIISVLLSISVMVAVYQLYPFSPF